MRVSVAVWQPCELLCTCYLLTYHTPALHYTHSTACTRCGSVTGLLTFDLPAGLRAVQFTTSSRRGAGCSHLGGRSGVAMAWAGWRKSSAAPECSGPEFQAKKKLKNNLLVTAKIGTPGYQTPERCIAILFLYHGVYRRRVHVGETFNRFADFGL